MEIGDRQTRGEDRKIRVLVDMYAAVSAASVSSSVVVTPGNTENIVEMFATHICPSKKQGFFRNARMLVQSVFESNAATTNASRADGGRAGGGRGWGPTNRELKEERKEGKATAGPEKKEEDALQAYLPTRTLHDLLGNNDGVDEVTVEPVAQLVDPRRDLVEADALLLTIVFDDEHDAKG